MQIKVKKLDETAQIPKRNHHDDAGYDLVAIEDKDLPFGVPTKIRTGIAMEIPSGWRGLIWSRSGLGSKGIDVMAGVIDAQYRGEVVVCLINLNMGHIHTVKKGDRIAQIVIDQNDPFEMTEGKLSETERGEKGFGSSGR